MSASVFVLKRNKGFGYYQDDGKSEVVFEFMGYDALEYVTTNFGYEPIGTAVLSEENEQGRVLKSVEEYVACQNEDMEYRREHFMGLKYVFYYRVEERFFDGILNSEDIEDFECSDKEWLLEQLNKFKAAYESFDFKNNYFYVVESY